MKRRLIAFLCAVIFFGFATGKARADGKVRNSDTSQKPSCSTSSIPITPGISYTQVALQEYGDVSYWVVIRAANDQLRTNEKYFIFLQAESQELVIPCLDQLSDDMKAQAEKIREDYEARNGASAATRKIDFGSSDDSSVVVATTDSSKKIVKPEAANKNGGEVVQASTQLPATTTTTNTASSSSASSSVQKIDETSKPAVITATETTTSTTLSSKIDPSAANVTPQSQNPTETASPASRQTPTNSSSTDINSDTPASTSNATPAKSFAPNGASQQNSSQSSAVLNTIPTSIAGYRFLISSNNNGRLVITQRPAIFAENPSKKVWGRVTRTFVTFEKDGQGNIWLRAPIQNFDEDAELAFYVEEKNTVITINGRDPQVRNGKGEFVGEAVSEQFPKGKFKKRDYAALNEQFKVHQGPMKRFFIRPTLHYGLPTVLGFMTGGPIGGGVGIATSVGVDLATHFRNHEQKEKTLPKDGL